MKSIGTDSICDTKQHMYEDKINENNSGCQSFYIVFPPSCAGGKISCWEVPLSLSLEVSKVDAGGLSFVNTVFLFLLSSHTSDLLYTSSCAPLAT